MSFTPVFWNSGQYLHSAFLLLGAFSLDLSWHPMPTFLAGKFAWAKILAEQKALKLIIQDNPLASHGLEDVASEGESSKYALQELYSLWNYAGDVEQSLPALLPAHGTYLQVDTFKIEQVIRNLITNAVKYISFHFYIISNKLLMLTSNAQG